MTKIISMGHPSYRHLIKNGAQTEMATNLILEDDNFKGCRGEVAHGTFTSKDGKKVVDKYADKYGNTVTYGSELTNNGWRTYFQNTHKIRPDRKSYISETVREKDDDVNFVVRVHQKDAESDDFLDAVYARNGKISLELEPKGNLILCADGTIRAIVPIKYTEKGTEFDKPFGESVFKRHKVEKEIVKMFNDSFARQSKPGEGKLTKLNI